METELTNYVDWIFTAGLLQNYKKIMLYTVNISWIYMLFQIEQAILAEQKTTDLERRHIMDS